MSDWDLIGGDPAPGDPGSIRTLAHEIQSTADRAHEARVALDGCTNDILSIGWEGEAATKFHATFAPMAPSLGLMAESYELASSALGSHAGRLDQLQAEVARALARARVARQRRDATGPQLDAARASVNRLNAELNAVSAAERRNVIVAPLYATDPASSAAHTQELQHLQSTHRSVASALSNERTRFGSLQREVDDANGEINAAKAVADAIRSDFHRLERSTADRLHDALEKGLKNESNFHRFLHAAAEVGKDLLCPELLIAEILSKVDWHKVLLALHDFLKVMNDIATLVLPIVAFLFPPAAALLAVAAAVIAIATFVTGLAAYFTSTEEERKAHGLTVGELAWEGGGALFSGASAFKELREAQGVIKGAEAGGVSALEHYKQADDTVVSYMKRIESPNMRKATGWIRDFHGTQRSVTFAKGALVVKGVETYDYASSAFGLKGDAQGASQDFANGFLKRSNTELRSGVSVPYAGGCYQLVPAA